MTLQVLVAAVKQNAKDLAATINLRTDAIIINQDDYFSYEEFDNRAATVRAYTFAERGVGLSRNNALFRAEADIVLFSDEDIILEDDYHDIISNEFSLNPQADLIIFNINREKHLVTYHNKNSKRVRWYNYGRYGACGIAARTKKLHEANISFSLLFGGGAKYSNGEDSLFLRDCLRNDLKIYASPLNVGSEVYRESTWFDGYTEKFFYDRGVLYRYLYGFMAKPFALRFLFRKRHEMCKEIKLKQAFKLMKSGINQEARK